MPAMLTSYRFAVHTGATQRAYYCAHSAMFAKLSCAMCSVADEPLWIIWGLYWGQQHRLVRLYWQARMTPRSLGGQQHRVATEGLSEMKLIIEKQPDSVRAPPDVKIQRASGRCMMHPQSLTSAHVRCSHQISSQHAEQHLSQQNSGEGVVVCCYNAATAVDNASPL